MTGRIAALAMLLAAFAVTPAFAQEAGEPQARNETCAEVSLDGDFELKIPCPPGTRQLLEQLPRPADPAPRRDIVIDPEWPHDQAMVAGHDWPYDQAMIVPQADAEEETIPLFDDLLGLFNRHLSGSSERESRGEPQSPDRWYFETNE